MRGTKTEVPDAIIATRKEGVVEQGAQKVVKLV
jgi:hypothetical protein